MPLFVAANVCLIYFLVYNLIMPNHFHAIISIIDKKCVGADSISAQNNNIQIGGDIESASTITMENIVQSFKRQTTL